MTWNSGAPARRITIALAASAALIAPVLAFAPTANAVGTADPVMAAGSTRSAVSLTAPTAAPYGAQIALSGVLWRYGTSTKIAGSKVTLQRSLRGKNVWGNVASINTTATGTYKFTVTQTVAYDYRAYYAGNATYTTAVSAVKYPVVMQRVLLDSVATVNYNTGILRATGRVYPATTGKQVYLQRYNPATKAWSNIAAKTTSGNTISVDAKVGGSTGQYRLSVPVTMPYGAGVSAARTLSHYVWRDVFKKPVLAKGGSEDYSWEIFREGPYLVGFADALELGNVWVDLNTAGCTRYENVVGNDAEEPFTFRMLNGTTALRALNVAAGPDPETSGLAFVNGSFGGATKVRLQFTDIGNQDMLFAWMTGRVLCAN
ncbi:hypothetical protein [Kribbella deserti]|uniref:Uncharacterized protein n=1 Tax=Kribbella deserti TaxID=1926257 RepID=A0ABV6QM48_9ACTN